MKHFQPYLLLIMLASCITDQKAIDHLQRRKQLAPLCAAIYPPEVTFVPGKVITKRDTQYLPGAIIPCPPGGTDTLWMKCPPTKVIHDTTVQRDTLRIRDIAAETAQKDRIDSLTMVNYNEREKAEEAQGKAQKRLQGLIALGIVAVLLFVYSFKKTFLS